MKHNGMYSVEHLQLESFQDLNMFVCECLRMYPTQMTTRKVTESFIFDGHIISVGTFIDIDLLLLHMNPVTLLTILILTLSTKVIIIVFITVCIHFSAAQFLCPAEKGRY
jgi:hypothetical protein